MSILRDLDCVVIGYNEPPFEEYEKLIGQYGRDSEAYRDLQFSFVDLEDEKLNYVDLMNHVFRLAGHEDVSFASGEIPSLAAAYLKNFLHRRGYNADYVNLFQYEKEKLIEFLESDPHCVAITTTLYVINFPVNEMVDFIRQHNDKVKIVVGGPLIANHVRNYQGESLQAALGDMGADIYVHESQGELTLSRIVQCLREGGDLASVPNLYYRSNGGYAMTLPEPENNSLDEDFINWRELSNGDLGVTLQTRTARSCAFSCAFCNYPTRAGKLTLASIETIERELDSMYERGNVKNVVFIDDTFNVPLPRFKDICRLMIRKGYGFNWFSYFRCSNSDEEAVELMEKSGCKGVFLGIESGSPTILENMNKRATLEKYTRGIELLRKHEILTFGSFIIGFPGETEQTIQETIDFIEETQPDYYRTQMWYNEPGTPIAQQRDKYAIEGDGFVWSHSTMDSMEAMDHIERIFLSVKASQWLPQWSFDFWIIPYLMGKKITRQRFKAFMESANKLLRLEIATVAEHEKSRLQQQYLRDLVAKIRTW